MDHFHPRPSGRALLVRPAVVLAVVVAVLAGTLAPAVATTVVDYRPPTDAAVVDHFRAPVTAWGAGNRGLDYATARGDLIGSAAPGTVTFAGPVAGSIHVVVLHADGLRTSYSFVAVALVARGQRVDAGQPVAIAAGAFHFGVRAGDTYLDPTSLFATGPPVVHLVEDRHRTMGTVAAERRGLVQQLGGWLGQRARAVVHGGAAGAAWLGATSSDVAQWSAEATRQMVHAVAALGVAITREVLARARGMLRDLELAAAYASQLDPTQRMIDIALRAASLIRSACTSAGVVPPPPPRRVVVLVGGLGASSERTALRQLPTDALGYPPVDVVQFSYTGGAVPGVSHGTFAGGRYTSADTAQDLQVSAALLGRLLVRVARRHPGTGIDIVAHSQGGVVARLALAELGSTEFESVTTLVTLASPHGGADLATALDGVAGTFVGDAALALGDVAEVVEVGPSLAQLSETSPVIESLAHTPLPPGTTVTSISAAGDLVVPGRNSHLVGAHNTIIDVHGPSAHSDVVTHPDTLREMRLAAAGAPPTCVPTALVLARVFEGEAISVASDLAGVAANVGVRRLEGVARAPSPSRTPTPRR